MEVKWDLFRGAIRQAETKALENEELSLVVPIERPLTEKQFSELYQTLDENMDGTHACIMPTSLSKS